MSWSMVFCSLFFITYSILLLCCGEESLQFVKKNAKERERELELYVYTIGKTDRAGLLPQLCSSKGQKMRVRNGGA